MLPSDLLLASGDRDVWECGGGGASMGSAFFFEQLLGAASGLNSSFLRDFGFLFPQHANTTLTLQEGTLMQKY